MAGFAAEAVVEMVPQAGWRRVRVDAVRPGAGPTGANLRTVREGWLYFPPAVETLDYDLDGNLISDARWSYGWDGENRLVWMEEKVIPGGGIRPARLRLEFGYDGQSRRVVKRVLVKTSEASQWSLRQERRFLYDGWNMIGELDVPSNGQARLHRSYAWGLDASGTLTGAGGVGGLLLTSHHTPQAGGGTQVTTLAPLYDFNGNVLAYADVATSTITHRMEYDPFGQELSLDTLLPGEGAAEAPRFRFSTKYTDGETGLVYYGYRSYSPELGRWLSRDPIAERGGLNLYGMVRNNPVNFTDRLGLDVWTENTTAVGGWHRRICVDTWDDKCCKKIGKYCISFGVDGGGTGSGSGGSPNNPSAPSVENGGSSDSGSSDQGGSSGSSNSSSDGIDNGDGAGGDGVVYEDNDDPSTAEKQRKTKTCEQDKAIKKKLEGMVGNRANYNICTQSCRHFSGRIFDEL